MRLCRFEKQKRYILNWDEDGMEKGEYICYETDDIQAQIKQFEEMGYMLVSDAKEAILFNMKKVAFMMTNMGLIELVEK